MAECTSAGSVKLERIWTGQTYDRVKITVELQFRDGTVYPTGSQIVQGVLNEVCEYFDVDDEDRPA
ncbi:MAG: hypothetical protein ACT4TC_03730 [Myxococcaceae bacterium]